MSSYLEDLKEKLNAKKKRLASVETRLLLTNTSDPSFWNLVSERNNLTVDVATAKDRIANHNKPGIVPTVQIIIQ